MAPPDVLFLGHGAERSGPPVFLANLQRWLGAHRDVRGATVVARGGPLLADYGRFGPVRVLDRRWTLPRIAQQGLERLGRPGLARWVRGTRDVATLRGWTEPRLAYVNTVAPDTLRLLDLMDDDVPVVLHVHELEAALRYRLDDAHRLVLRDRPVRFLAASHAVADNLVANHGVERARIRVHHELVEPVAPLAPGERASERARQGIPPEAFVVGGSGMTEWRKAPDLFVRLAAELRARTDRPLCFLWVGGAAEGPEWAPLDHDARRLGVAEVVRFLGPQERPGDWYRLLDAFALTSREDAFPLSALEAATAGVPVVTFDTGGMVEFVDDEVGAVVAYPDVAAMATALAALAGDEPRRAAMGEAAAARARARHLTDVGAPALWADVAELLR